MLKPLADAWHSLNSSYWFVPAVLGVGAALLSMLTLSIDLHLPDDWLERVDVAALPTIQSEGARSVLTTVASSMITVAGVVFSLTLLVLTQASSQFGPRLLVNFMRDRTTQFVLGVFVATFVYALLVLRVVSGGDSDAGIDSFVPQLSVLVALALTFLTVAVLVYFIHHIAQSVRVTHILSKVDDTLERMLEGLEERAQDADDAPGAEDVPTAFRADLGVLPARRGGYLQAVAIDALVESAAKRGAVVRLIPTVGDFVMKGAPLAEVHPATATDALADDMHGALSIGTDRSLTQDLGFVYDELLEIALRALSPSLNDPFTARSCIDRIAQGLLLLDRRRLPPQVHADDEGVVRAFVPLQGKGALARHLFGELRRAAAGNLFVTQHLLETLAKLRREVVSVALGSAIDEAMEAIVAAAKAALPALDHARLEAVLARSEGSDVGRAPEGREPAGRTRS
jgi:uncharacterized membrane protein